MSGSAMKSTTDYGAIEAQIPTATKENGSPLLAHVAFILNGAALCIGWQANICSLDFFMMLLPGYPIQYLVGVVAMGILIIMTVLMIPLSRVLNPVWTLFVSCCLILVSLTAVPAMNILLVLPGETPLAPVSTLCFIVIGSLMVNAAVNATLQSSLYALAGEWSVEGELTASCETGKGVAGVAIAFARMATKASFSPDLHGQARSTIWFFGIGFVCVVIAIIAFVAMLQLPVITERRSRRRKMQSGESNALTGNRKEETSSVYAIFMMVFRQAITVLMVFTTTLACFPGLTSTLESVTFSLGSWFPIVLIALYTIGDLIGKSLPGYWNVFKNCAHRLPYAALVHALFLPMFVARLAHPWLGDYYACALVFLLGCFTGYISCAAMMLGPEQCSKAADKEMAGLVDATFLVSGLALGSFVGLAIGSVIG